MFDYLDFEEVSGTDTEKDLKLLALSTCGFCKRAKAFLKEFGLAYKVVDVDSLDKSVRLRIREDFSSLKGKAVTYPTLLIGDDDMLTGFIRPLWMNTLGLEEKDD
jgi:glutaredoxin